MTTPRPPKEKVLHTRVPEALDAQIKALAEALRVPVSSLVRNILEDSVAVMESATSGLDETLRSVTANVRTLSEHAKAEEKELRRGWTEFQAILGEAFRARGVETPRRPAASRAAETAPSERTEVPSAAELPEASALFPEVLGWQPLTLNVAATCARCATSMLPGDTAELGVGGGPGRVLICPACLPRSRGR